MPRALVGTSLAGAACLALTAGLTALAPGAGAAGGRSVVSGARPSWASSAALRGAAPASDTVHLRVYLNYRDPVGLAATAAAVSTPGSAAYGHYLTPAQFRQKYSPSASDAAGVANFLRKAGFSVANTPDNNRYVAVEGTVAQANATFATRVGLYGAYGTTLRAPETDPSVPAEVAGLVSGVVGLDDSPKLQAPAATPARRRGRTTARRASDSARAPRARRTTARRPSRPPSPPTAATPSHLLSAATPRRRCAGCTSWVTTTPARTRRSRSSAPTPAPPWSAT